MVVTSDSGIVVSPPDLLEIICKTIIWYVAIKLGLYLLLSHFVQLTIFAYLPQ